MIDVVTMQIIQSMLARREDVTKALESYVYMQLRAKLPLNEHRPIELAAIPILMDTARVNETYRWGWSGSFDGSGGKRSHDGLGRAPYGGARTRYLQQRR